MEKLRINVKVQDGFITRANVTRRLEEKMRRLERDCENEGYDRILNDFYRILWLTDFLHDVGLLTDRGHAELDGCIADIRDKCLETAKRQEKEQWKRGE